MSTLRDLLFVYGTLLSGDTGQTGRTQRARLARETRRLASGTTNGRLYNLGRYPGLVLPASSSEIVHGEVLELAIADRTLRWLDVYEGIVPGRLSIGEYERIKLDITLGLGRDVEAWAYVYRASLAGAKPLPDGRWLQP